MAITMFVVIPEINLFDFTNANVPQTTSNIMNTKQL